MDVALHRAPVTFVLYRAGATGDDGPSHNGMWDLSLFQLVPGLRVAAPRDAETLRRALREAVAVDAAPTALRFPKGAAADPVPALDTVAGLDVLHPSGTDPDVLLVSVGPLAPVCLAAAELLRERGVGVTVVDPRWIQPVAPALIDLGLAHRAVVSVEDSGRCRAALAQALADAGARRPVQVMGLPQRLLAQGRREDILARAGLTADGILHKALSALDRSQSPRCGRRPSSRSTTSTT